MEYYPLYKGGERGGSGFSHKNGGVGKIGGVIFFKKKHGRGGGGGGVPLIFILTNPF